MKSIIYALCFSLTSLAPAQAEAPTVQTDTMPQLKFHESWSAEESAALAEYLHFLQEEYSLTIDAPPPSLARKIYEAFNDKPLESLVSFFREHLQVLRRIIESGDASLRTPAYLEGGVSNVLDIYDDTAALMALRHGRFDIVKILVMHGCDPNYTCGHESGKTDHLLSILLSGQSFFTEVEKSYAERLELAQWLLDHGADINAPCLVGLGNLGACLFELHSSGDSTCLNWALERGLKHQPQPQDGYFLQHPYAILFICRTIEILPIVKRLHETGNLPLNDLSWGRTPLQYICSSSSDHDEDREQTLLYLLEQGADPNLIGGFEEDDEELIDDRFSPLQYLEQDEAENEAHAAHLERMKTILLQHGAK